MSGNEYEQTYLLLLKKIKVLSGDFRSKHNRCEKDSGYSQSDKMGRPFFADTILVNIMHVKSIQVMTKATKWA